MLSLRQDGVVGLNGVVLHLLVQELLVVFLSRSFVVALVFHGVLELELLLDSHGVLLLHFEVVVLESFLLVANLLSVLMSRLLVVVGTLLLKSVSKVEELLVPTSRVVDRVHLISQNFLLKRRLLLRLGHMVKVHASFVIHDLIDLVVLVPPVQLILLSHVGIVFKQPVPLLAVSLLAVKGVFLLLITNH